MPLFARYLCDTDLLIDHTQVDAWLHVLLSQWLLQMKIWMSGYFMSLKGELKWNSVVLLQRDIKAVISYGMGQKSRTRHKNVQCM